MNNEKEIIFLTFVNFGASPGSALGLFWALLSGITPGNLMKKTIWSVRDQTQGCLCA